MDWTEVPVYRGITEIEPLLEVVLEREDTFILGGYARYCCSPRYNPHEAQDGDLVINWNDYRITAENAQIVGDELTSEDVSYLKFTARNPMKSMRYD